MTADPIQEYIARATCVNCKHFYVHSSEPGYSSWTPGSDMRMGCNKNHWELEQMDDTNSTFKQKITMSRKCKDFTNANAE